LSARCVAVHRVAVILSTAKNLAWLRGTDEILPCAQNDVVFRLMNGYAIMCYDGTRPQDTLTGQRHIVYRPTLGSWMFSKWNGMAFGAVTRSVTVQRIDLMVTPSGNGSK
jgi:hypothetical protein